MQVKPAKIRDLEAELAPLQAARAEIDLEGLQQELDRIKADAAEQLPHVQRPGVFTEGERRISLTVSAAENAFDAEQRRAQHLDSVIAPLHAMITAPARVTSCRSAVDQAATVLDITAGAVASAEATLEQLRNACARAQTMHTEEVNAAAREMLAAARDGRAALPTPNNDRSMIEATEAALALALADLSEAQTARDAAAADHRTADDLLQTALRDEARLTLELASRDFAHVVVAYRRTASGHWPDEVLRRHVLKLESAGA